MSDVNCQISLLDFSCQTYTFAQKDKTTIFAG